jgi:hypothetical protein
MLGGLLFPERDLHHGMMFEYQMVDGCFPGKIYKFVPWLTWRRSCQQGVCPAWGNKEIEQGTSTEPR